MKQANTAQKKCKGRIFDILYHLLLPEVKNAPPLPEHLIVTMRGGVIVGIEIDFDKAVKNGFFKNLKGYGK